jgi:DNA-directed RNA polymerase specialized sigma subunit
MYNWKTERNYKRLRDENGNVIANVIYVDGVEVSVSDEVYEAYASMDRRERYLEEREGAEKPLSFEMLLEEGYTEDALCSAENLEDTISDKLLYRKLKTVLGNLDTADQEMIRTVFFDGISMREYAKRIGVYPRAVVYRMERLLKTLRNKLQ